MEIYHQQFILCVLILIVKRVHTRTSWQSWLSFFSVMEWVEHIFLECWMFSFFHPLFSHIPDLKIPYFYTCHIGHLSSEMSAQLSRISHTLSVIFPACPDELIGLSVIKLNTNRPPSPELHVKVCIDEIHCLLCFMILIFHSAVYCRLYVCL